MSARALNWAWQQTPKTATQKLILAALADRADDDGECFPSTAWIAEKCSPVPAETVRRVLRDLADQGLVEKTERRRRNDGTLGTWLYRLPIDQRSPVTSGHERTLDQRSPMHAPACTSERAETSIEPTTKSSPDGEDAKAKGRVPRDRDPIWDVLVELFGAVADRTNAHAKRNKAVGDLRRLGATPDAIKAAHRSWPKLFEGATPTDVAIATHYPQLAQAAGIRDGQTPTRAVCDECGVGGGLHVADCSKVVIAA